MDRLEQAVVWREQNPIRLAANSDTRARDVRREDFRVPETTSGIWAALQRQKVESKLIVFPTRTTGTNGENSRFFYKEVPECLGKWIDAAHSVLSGGKRQDDVLCSDCWP